MATWEKLMHQKHIYTISKMTAILTKIRHTIPLIESPLARSLTKGVESEKYFHQNSNSFYTKHLCTHLLYLHIIFLWHTLYFSVHMHSPMIRPIICFGMIIINIIFYARKRKTCIIFGRKINNIVA